MSDRPIIAVIDDEPAICDILSASLKDEGFQVFIAKNGEEGLALIEDQKPAIALLDIWMPGHVDGIEVLKQSKLKGFTTEFIMMSGHGTIETAVKSTKLGAWDFVEKPISMDRVLILIQNILSYLAEKTQKNALLSKLRKNIALIGDSREMVQLKQSVARVAPTQTPVLIQGEHGTGKELLANNIHYLSRRAGQSFVELNCAAIPEELVEAELFGYEKGLFASGMNGRKGRLELAEGGTLFLDQISELNLKVQGLLLRVLSSSSFERQGSVSTQTSNVRLVVSSVHDLAAQVKAGKFLKDLYDQLNVVVFNVPSLQQRREDIPALVQHFSELFSRGGGYSQKIFTQEALEKMMSYPWPGNVRELRNFIERLFILVPADLISAEDLKMAGLPLDEDQDVDFAAFFAPSFKSARAQFEKEYILRKLDENDRNISRTAEIIGIERSHLHRKIKAYGIEV